MHLEYVRYNCGLPAVVTIDGTTYTVLADIRFADLTVPAFTATDQHDFVKFLEW